MFKKIRENRKIKTAPGGPQSRERRGGEREEGERERGRQREEGERREERLREDIRHKEMVLSRQNTLIGETRQIVPRVRIMSS